MARLNVVLALLLGTAVTVVYLVSLLVSTCSLQSIPVATSVALGRVTPQSTLAQQSAHVPLEVPAEMPVEVPAEMPVAIEREAPAFLLESAAPPASRQPRKGPSVCRSEAVALVVAANGRYVNKAVQFLEQARTVGEWDGDLIALHDGKLEAAQLQSLETLGVTLVKAEALVALAEACNSRPLSFHYAKLDLFVREVFRGYSRLLYVDVDHAWARPFQACPTDAFDDIARLRSTPADDEAVPLPSGAVLAAAEMGIPYRLNFRSRDKRARDRFSDPLTQGVVPLRNGGRAVSTRLMVLDVQSLQHKQVYWAEAVALGSRFGFQFSNWGEQGFLLALLTRDLVAANLPFAPDTSSLADAHNERIGHDHDEDVLLHEFAHGNGKKVLDSVKLP